MLIHTDTHRHTRHIHTYTLRCRNTETYAFTETQTHKLWSSRHKLRFQRPCLFYSCSLCDIKYITVAVTSCVPGFERLPLTPKGGGYKEKVTLSACLLVLKGVDNHRIIGILNLEKPRRASAPEHTLSIALFPGDSTFCLLFISVLPTLWRSLFTAWPRGCF